MTLVLPFPPHEAANRILKNLSGRRMREVLEKRFGLRTGKRKTLEAIGAEYKITRERVRQIEAEALRQSRRPETLGEVEPFIAAAASHLNRCGRVMAEDALLSSLADGRDRPHIAFLLAAVPQFQLRPETGEYRRRWASDPETARRAEDLINRVVRDFEESRQCVSEEQLRSMVARRAAEALGMAPEPEAADSYLGISQLIRRNPYGEYGLSHWSMVSPSGVKEKAHAALAKAGKPLHFLEVAEAINRVGWSSRRAHPQTVHNELIKDSRFVLVGRGLYALGEWGYEPGSVRDVMAAVLREAGRPLSRDEIIQGVLAKRMVKVPTILLNLNNRSLFRRTDGGQYALA